MERSCSPGWRRRNTVLVRKIDNQSVSEWERSNSDAWSFSFSILSKARLLNVLKPKQHCKLLENPLMPAEATMSTGQPAMWTIQRTAWGLQQAQETLPSGLSPAGDAEQLLSDCTHSSWTPPLEHSLAHNIGATSAVVWGMTFAAKMEESNFRSWIPLYPKNTSHPTP